MKTLFAGVGGGRAARGCNRSLSAQETTVIHKEGVDGHSKTIVHHANGSKTVIKRHGSHVRKVHTSSTGERTVVEKSVEH